MLYLAWSSQQLWSETWGGGMGAGVSVPRPHLSGFCEAPPSLLYELELQHFTA